MATRKSIYREFCRWRYSVASRKEASAFAAYSAAQDALERRECGREFVNNAWKEYKSALAELEEAASATFDDGYSVDDAGNELES